MFVLARQKNIPVDEKSDHQIVYLSHREMHILPAINLDYYVKNGFFEASLIEWAKQLCSPDKVFLDIGAHSGTYAISMSYKSKHVVAFEPQRRTYHVLCGSVGLSDIDNITCLNVGLGSPEQIGVHDLYIVSIDGGGSTLIKPDEKSIIKTEKVEIKTLDSFKLSEIGFIKVDVEGNEANVFKGAVDTLKRNNYPKILFESNTQESTPFIMLKDIGYNISKINEYPNMFLAAH